MSLRNIKNEASKKAFLTALVVGTVLNLVNNGEYIAMLLESASFSWESFWKISANYMVPFIVALYSQRFFTSIYLALRNIKNAFYMVDRKGRVVFVSNKLVDEINKIIGDSPGRQLAYHDLIGMNIKDLRSEFGFDEKETEEILKKFKAYGEVDAYRQVIGKLVNGRRYGLIASSNLALVRNPFFPAQGMFIPREDLSRMERGVVMMLAKAAEGRNGNCADRITKMRKHCRVLGRKLGLSEDDMEALDAGAVLHDVGNVGIADSVLNKPGELAPDEWEIMKTHTVKGGEILRNGNNDFFSRVAVIAEQHHEHYDGSGYPGGLKGEEIDLLARIVAVVDTFNVLTGERDGKKEFSSEEVFKEMKARKGKELDPVILDAFLSV
ncbi:MAG: HD-GYP domain-containing protein [Nitrospinales bacterium]